MRSQRDRTVTNLFVAVMLLQAWLHCQALEETYIHDSKYHKSFMKVISTGGKAIINPATKNLGDSEKSITIYPYRIAEKTYGTTLTLKGKEFSFKEADTYNDIPAYSATVHGAIQSGSISITYTLFTDPKRHPLRNEGDVWVDIEVKGWNFCQIQNCDPPAKSFLEITMFVETKTGAFEPSESNLVDTSIDNVVWNNPEVPVQLYSMKSAKLDGVKTEIEVTSVNSTSQQMTYKIRSPKFTSNFTCSAIWFNFPRTMPKSGMAQNYPCVIVLAVSLALALLEALL